MYSSTSSSIVLTNSVSIGSTTQRQEPMPIDQASWIGHKPELSADCLNAWVTYGHSTPYCTTYVSTAVILRSTKIETSHSRF